MQPLNVLFCSVLFVSSVFGSDPYSAALVHASDASSCPCSGVKPYAPSHGYASHRHAEENIMRSAGYGAPSYGGPSYGAGYASHSLSYVPAHSKKPHSGLVISCQPNLAGYAHGIDEGSSGAGGGYGGSGGYEASAYRSSSDYSRPYLHMSYASPASHGYAHQGYNSPSYEPPAYGYSPPSYHAPAPAYSAPAPAYSAPVPVYSAPAPAYSAPAPAYSAPVPVYSAPAPAYSAPAPAYSAPAPAYSAPAPAYKAPSYSASAPAYSVPAYAPAAAPSYSSYNAPKPSYGASAYSVPMSYEVAPSYDYRAADEEVHKNKVTHHKTTKVTTKKEVTNETPVLRSMDEVASKIVTRNKNVAKDAVKSVADIPAPVKEMFERR